MITSSVTSAATTNSVWSAHLKVGAMTGGSTLDEVAGGTRATVSVKLYRVKPGALVGLRLDEGTCPSTAVVASRLSFRAPASGPAVHRFTLTRAELATLKADIARKDAFSVSASVGTASGCGTYAAR
jgi:hypothetical protein